MAETDDNTLGLGLFILRITLAAFFMIWALEKLLLPDTANGIAGYFYGFQLPPGILTVVGLMQVALIITFALGVHRTVTYGIVTLYHAGSTFSTWFILIDPYGRTASGTRTICFWPPSRFWVPVSRCLSCANTIPGSARPLARAV